MQQHNQNIEFVYYSRWHWFDRCHFVGRIALGAFIVFVLTALTAAGATSDSNPTTQMTLNETAVIASSSAGALIILFVVSLLIESALSVIFNWRLFIELFNGRGVKTLVSIAMSALTVSAFHLETDVFEALLGSYGVTSDAGAHSVSFALTTLILAGGSAGVYRILVALGYRQARPETQSISRAPRGEAWVALRIIRKRAVGPIDVFISKLPEAIGDQTPELTAVLTQIGFLHRLKSVFFPDQDRYPSAAGHSVQPSVDYKIRVDAYDTSGVRIDCSLDSRTYRFADGAIIDFLVIL